MRLGPLMRYRNLLDLGFIFQYLPSLFDLFTFFYFLIFIAIYIMLLTLIDVNEVINNVKVMPELTSAL